MTGTQGWLPRPRTRLQWGIAWVSLALVYFLAARLGLSLTFVNASASPVWPPTGVAIAALLVLGLRAWPGVTLGAYLANALTTGWGWPSLAIAGGNTLEAFAAAWLVLRWAGGSRFLDTPSGLLRYTGLAALGGTLLSASLGVATLVASGNAPAAAAGQIWLTWWLGDATGALLVGIPLVAWAQPRPGDSLLRPEVALIFGILASLALIVFSPLLAQSSLLLLLLPLPVLVWAGLRLGPRGASAAALLLASIAVYGTLRRHGPLVSVTPNTELLLLQAYVALGALAALGLSAWAGNRHADGTDETVRLRRQVLTVGLVVAIALTLLGLAVLTGWFLHVDGLKAPLPGAASMKANTALCFTLIGTAMLLSRNGRRSGWLGVVLASVPILVGSLTLLQYLGGWSFGIDELLVKDDLHAIATSAPGRMSPLTATGFILLGTSLLTRDHPAPWRTVSDAAALAASTVGLLALTSYVYGAYLFGSVTQVAVHTSVGLLAGGFAVLLLNPERGIGATFASPEVDGRLARLLPVGIVLVPLLLGLVRLQLQDEGRLSLEQGVVLSIFGTMVLVALVAVLTLTQARTVLAQRKAAETALQRSEQHFRGLLEAAPDATLVVDARGRIMLVNGEAERLFGYTRQELLASSIEALVPDEVRGRHADLRAQYMAHPGVRQMGPGRRLTARHKDGHGVPVEISLSPLQQPEGLLVIAAVRDVTRQREAQEALARNLRSVAEAERVTGRGSWEWDVTTNKAVWSEGMYRLFGVDPATFVNSNENFLAMVLPEDRERMGAAMAKALAKPDRFFQEYRLRRPDGRIVYLEGEGSVVADPDGKARMLYGVVQDVTELKVLREARERAQERFKTIFDTSPVAISLSTAEGGIVDVNAAFCNLSGYTREELLAPTFLASTLYADLDERGRMINALREHGAVRNLELHFVRKDGELRTVLGNLQFVDVGGGTTILGLFQDITQRLQAQMEREARIASEAELERLRRTDQFRSQFINSTAHELSTPLTPLVLNVRTLLQDLSLAPAQRRQLESMERAISRLKHLVADMVGAADLQARNMALDKRRLNLNRELKAAIAANHAAAVRLGVTLTDPDDTGETVVADPARLQLVLGHLLGNALKFTPANGRVWLATRRQGTEVRVSVNDTGIGLTAQQIDQLWKPFSQAHDKMQRTQSGSGLGLFVTKGIIELHGGEVGCSSPGPGKGSTFWFTLPLATGHVDPLAAKAAPETPSKRADLNPGVADEA